MKDKLFSMDYESEKTNECFWDIQVVNIEYIFPGYTLGLLKKNRDRSTRLNSSHPPESRMPSSA